MFRLTYENRGVYTTEDNLDFISDTCGVVDRLIEIIVSGVPTGQQVDVKTDQMTWLQLSKVINNGETKLDNIENMVMMYNAVQTRPISQNKKTGVISINGDWELRSVVLTASVPLEFQITPDGFTSDAQIELKQLLFFKEDYREWQGRDFMSGEPSDEFFGQPLAELDAGSIKVGYPTIEAPCLRLHDGDNITEVLFGSTETVKQWIRMIHWYTDGGFANKAPPEVGGEDDAGGKKKKK